MKVLVTGGTGFTGTATVPLLLDKGWDVSCFVRSTSNRSLLSDSRIKWLQGDISEVDVLARALKDVDALVNIVSLGFGHAQGIVKAATHARLGRAVFVSTTAIFTKLNAPSKSVRVAAEHTITESNLAYTILRPTMIYGTSRDRNMCRLIRYLQKWPAIPVLGSGTHLQQPVYVGDIASAIVQSLESPVSECKAYNISGAAPLSYDQVIDTVCSQLGRKIKKIHFPEKPFVTVLRSFERFNISFPIKAEQILRLNEDKCFDHSEADQDFNYRPRSFSEGIALELAEMGIQ